VRLAAQALGQDSFKFWWHYRRFTRYTETAMQAITQVGLQDKAGVPAAILPHGDQRKLELAILLASDAELFLLDEPTAGMATEQVPSLIETIRHIQQTSAKTIMLVEHNMNVVMNISDRITVMHLDRSWPKAPRRRSHRMKPSRKPIWVSCTATSRTLSRRTRHERHADSGCARHSYLYRGIPHSRRRLGDSAAGQHHSLAGAQWRGQNDYPAQHYRLTPPRRGDIWFKGHPIQGTRTHKIAQMGIGYVPEKRIIFRDLTVGQNLQIAERQKGDLDRKADFIFGLFPDLKRLYHLPGGNLSGGQQQMLAVARALVPDNDLLLIDEPSEGLAR